MKKYLLVCAVSGWIAGAGWPFASAYAAQEMEVTVAQQDLTITRYAAKGHQLIIWVAPGYGSHQRAARVADKLAQRGIEVWHVDLADSLFLPKGTTTMRKLSGKYLAALIDYAHQQSGKQITLMTRSYGAIPVLRAARWWQKKHQQKPARYLSGAVLLSPELYSTIPSLGLAPEYMPIVNATNIPLMVYQGGARGNRWQLETVVDKLRVGGAQVLVKLQPGVTGMFYAKDQSPAALAALKVFPAEIGKILNLLEQIPTPVAPRPLVAIKAKGRGLDMGLKPYHGKQQPLGLNLKDANGAQVVRSEYKGKVTVVNFWATWCPPCVKEIPSLNRLREKMRGKPFELISVNYAEDPQHVKAFLKKVNVDFPVLLDSDGRVSANWNVLAFPSTFVIGVDGKIKYGVNAAIHWDNGEVIKVMNKLTKQ